MDKLTKNSCMRMEPFRLDLLPVSEGSPKPFLF
jgi:hypothetical protein